MASFMHLNALHRPPATQLPGCTACMPLIPLYCLARASKQSPCADCPSLTVRTPPPAGRASCKQRSGSSWACRRPRQSKHHFLLRPCRSWPDAATFSSFRPKVSLRQRLMAVPSGQPGSRLGTPLAPPLVSEWAEAVPPPPNRSPHVPPHQPPCCCTACMQRFTSYVAAATPDTAGSGATPADTTPGGAVPRAG